MAPARWRQVAELCDSALDLEPARRARFLDQACAGDALLRQEVEALLANEKQAPEFLELPALEMAASVLGGQETQAAPEPLPAGLEIGPYRIVAPVGGGGMGQVYQARDTCLDRDVAPKFLPATSAQESEAKALDAVTTIDPRKGQLVELCFFGGLTVEEAAGVLKVSPNTSSGTGEWPSSG